MVCRGAYLVARLGRTNHAMTPEFVLLAITALIACFAGGFIAGYRLCIWVAAQIICKHRPEAQASPQTAGPEPEANPADEPELPFYGYRTRS